MNPLTSYFDALLDSVFILNEQGEILYVNEVGATLCNQTPRKLIRQKTQFHKLFDFEPKIKEFDSLTSILELLPYREVQFTCTEGTEGRVQISLQPYFSEESERKWLVYMHDVALEARLQMKYHRELDQKQDVIEQLEKAKGELEVYSRDLEKMVNERTQEIQELNHTMKALLDSLSQGFFIFNKNGVCLNISSKACLSTIEKNPNNLTIHEALNLTTTESEKFKKWMSTLFMEMLPFEDLAALGPSRYHHSQGKEIQIDYYPLRSAEGSIEGVVTVATDITKLVEAEREVQIERAKAKMIVNLVQNKKTVQTFIKDSREFLMALRNELSKNSPNFIDIFRFLHTIKGGAAMFSVATIVNQAHQAEEIVQTLISPSHDSHQSELVPKLMSQINRLEESFSLFLNDVALILGPQVLEYETLIELRLNEFSKILSHASQKETAKLACEYLYNQVLLEPIENFFQVYQKAVDKAAEETEKKLAPLQIEKTDIMIFPKPYLPLFNVLVHSFRNSVDHGIELPNVRTEKGKPEKGQICVKFELKDNRLTVFIEDDGQGISPNVIRNKLKEKGIPFDEETDHEVIQHIFDPLFSTKDVVTETSGRGVGMDAIKSEVDKLNGRIWVNSEVGRGTRLNIELPYYDNDPSFGTNLLTSKAA